MTTIAPQAYRMILAAADNLIHLARLHGVLPTLETEPRQPLAMGNHFLRLALRPVRNPEPAAADNCRRPDLLEKLAYHEGARCDMSLEDCLSFLANGWKETPGRSYTQLVLQLTELLAAAPFRPYCNDDCRARTNGIEAELQALRKKVATYEARDALGLMPQPAGALGPDGKEWAKTAAGYQHVEAMVPRANGYDHGPFWYGWALRGAFVAGAEWQEGRKQLEMAAGAVHVATASPPPSNTLWRLLTNGYDFEFVNQLGDAHPEKSVLIDRATKNWQQICAEVASLRTTTAMSDAARDLLAERARQVQEEGWTPEHDDEHSNGEMAEAAACYAGTAHAPLSLKRRQCSGHWPWAAKWWKPSDARRDLIKAGALILAEIERMDRNGKTEPQDKAA